MTTQFNATKAARAIFKIMKEMGVKPNKPGRDCWIQEGKDEAFVCLNCNFIRVSVTEQGFQINSAHAVFPILGKRTTSFRAFKKQMGHVLFHMS
jgi:hypothetical protein